MKMSLLVALAELAIGFAVPVLAQQRDAVDRRTVQQRDLLGSQWASALYERMSRCAVYRSASGSKVSAGPRPWASASGVGVNNQ